MNKKSFYFKITYMKDTSYMDPSINTSHDIELTAWDTGGTQVDEHLTEEFPELISLFDHLDYEEICEGTIMIYNVSQTVTTNEIATLLQNEKFKVDYTKEQSEAFNG